MACTAARLGTPPPSNPTFQGHGEIGSPCFLSTMFVEKAHRVPIPYIFVSLYQCYARDTTEFVHAPEGYAESEGRE